MSVGHLRRGDDLVERRLRATVGDVVADRPVEQNRLLKHETDLRAQGRQRVVSDVFAVDADAAAVGIVEPGDEANQRGLPRTGGPHQGNHLTGLHGTAEVFEDGFPRPIREKHVFKLNPAPKRRRHLRAWQVLHRLSRLEDPHDAFQPHGRST